MAITDPPRSDRDEVSGAITNLSAVSALIAAGNWKAAADQLDEARHKIDRVGQRVQRERRRQRQQAEAAGVS